MVKFTTWALALGAVALASTACGGGSSSGSAASSGSSAPLQQPASLVADVGHADAFTISLTDPSGAPIRHLKAGTYSLAVNDESTIHNFHLSGAGVNDATSIGSAEKKTFKVTFTPGTYSFVCDAHVSSMHGKFTVS